MTQLSNIINKAVEESLSASNQIEPEEIIPIVSGQLDDLQKEQCLNVELKRRIRKAANYLGRSMIREILPDQSKLPFKVEGAVSLHGSSDALQLTHSLTRNDVEGVLDARKKRVSDERKSYDNWKRQFSALKPYWDKNPDWTYGQCLEAYLSDLQ